MGIRCVGILVILTCMGACGETKNPNVPPTHNVESVNDATTPDTSEDDAEVQETVDISDLHTSNGDDADGANLEDSESGTSNDAEELEDATTRGPEEVGSEDMSSPEIQEDTAPPTSELNVFFTAPAAGKKIEINQPFDVVVLTKDVVHGPELLEVVITSSIEGELAVLKPDFAGWASTSLTLTKPGWHTLTAKVVNPGDESFIEELEIGLCSYGQPETFDAGMVDPSWKVYGDAYFDNGGWLEMTGNEQGKHGAIYNIGDKVDPGDVELSFKIWTGEGLNTGADGFAMSVINVPTLFELEEVIDMGASGGCLGYGVSGNCGPLTIESFHIEFDTWKNDGNPNIDPSAGNHVAITLDGDPSNHVFWEAVVLEDAQWHEVVIKIIGQNIAVYFDGENIIQGDLPAFQFHGGFIGFSGTTGWATNYHRFDDLLVKQACEVP